jgi:hypothetical protein
VSDESDEKQTLFQAHIERVAEEAEDNLRNRKTGVDCEYSNHPEGAPFDAVVIVGVDTSSCCIRVEENKQVRVCWMCTVTGGFRDQFVCRCGEANAQHESKELTFVGEIQMSPAAERAAREAATR